MEVMSSRSQAAVILEPAMFRDPDRPLAERVRDLVGQMTLAEKLGQLGDETAAIPRLGIPAYRSFSEGVYGAARNGRATVFPQPIGLAATWDADLIRRVAAAIGDEARAKHHEALRRSRGAPIYPGLHLGAPNVNIFRDPRWGRGQETWGEDPLLAGTLGAAFVRGLQGDHPRYLRVAACAKDFACHGGSAGPFGSDASVSPRDLHETYLAPYRALAAAGVAAVAASPHCSSRHPGSVYPYLVSAVLRGAWGFAGPVIADNDGIDDRHADPDQASAAALAVRRGYDMACGGTAAHLAEALERGLICEADIDRALERLLATRFRLGMFDPPERVPYAATPLSVVGCPAHWELAYQAAVKSVVLLKNRSDLLPLRPDLRSIRVLGPAAADVTALLGSRSGLSGELTTILEGIVDRAPESMRLEYHPGAQLNALAASRQAWLFDPDTQPDVVIACMGRTPLLDGEDGAAADRADLALPAAQAELVRRLAATGVKIVLVLMGGGPIALGDLAELADAIVFAWHPGQAGGAAVADVLFGQVVPSGKLPVTFPHSAEDLPRFDDYGMAGRTYRYARRAPLYPFGFGLSYTSFAYRDLRLECDRVAGGTPLGLSVTLANTGADIGEEVAQVYISVLDAPSAPLSTLVGFQCAELGMGEARVLRFEIPAERLMLVGDDGVRRLVPGRYRVTVGGCAPGPRGAELGAPMPVSAEFCIE
jgi:beta-glucosidase